MSFAKLAPERIGKLFPFHFVLDGKLEICEFGPSLSKIVDLESSRSFPDHFRVVRPELSVPEIASLAALSDQLIVMETTTEPAVRFRGQFERLGGGEAILFVGSPWFNDINELQSAGLSLFDFALFDPLADLLQVIRTQQIATNDIKLLLEKINQQKRALQESTRVLEENQTRLKLLSAIAEKTINGVIITDRTGRIEWVNESFTRITGYRPDEVIGKKPGEFLQGPETDPETIRYLREQIVAGGQFSCEVLNYRRNGAKYWVKLVGSPLVDGNGEVVGYFALEEDITARVQSEQALRDAKERTEALAKRKNAFFTNMSHEIRTPLNAIVGMGQQLQKSDLTDEQRFFLDSINTAADHLMVLINDILDISKAEAGKLNLEMIDFDLRDVVRRCLDVLMPKANERGLHLRLLIDEQIAPYFVGDPFRVSQILLNLVGNAIKFTERGSISLIITSLIRSATHESMRFAVEDTGVGIDTEFVDHLFTEFSQEDSSVARKFGGSGLGLNITKKLVDLMHGSIDVKSRKNAGTTFYVDLTFPIGDAEYVEHETFTEADPRSLKGRSVLLVEDNEMNRILGRTILLNAGLEVLEAANGDLAIQWLRRRKFDIVLMDVQMPVLDGLAATEYIRSKIDRDVPILALTANALKGERDRCLAAGMNDYLSKPFREAELISKIGRLLGAAPAAAGRGDETPGKELYDLEYLREMADGDEEFFNRMIGIFCRDARAAMAELPKLAATDPCELKRSAHKLKSNLAMLRIAPGVEMAERIEYSNGDIAALDRDVSSLVELLSVAAERLEFEHAAIVV